MNRIVITGNSGSGKTWLGNRISIVLAIPCIALDKVFWEPGGYNIKRSDPDIEAELKQIQSCSSWVVEGVFGSLIDELISYADTVVFLDLSWEECKTNLVARGSESSKQLDRRRAEENFQVLIEWASAYYIRDSKASNKYHTFLFDTFGGNKYRVSSRDEIMLLWQTIAADREIPRIRYTDR
jgi:adenylate kinase family enzyme